MKPFRLNGQYIAIGAQLALMAIISYALVTTNHQTDNAPALDIKAEIIRTTPISKAQAPKAPTAKLPHPTTQIQPIIKPAKLDLAMKMLTPAQATLYRALFEAQNKGQWKQAETLIRRIKDRRLMGAVLADRFKKLGATLAEKKIWLERFPSLPQAKKIHAAAKKQGGKDLTAPSTLKKWSGGYVIDGASSFTAEQNLKKAADSAKTRHLARSIKRNIARGKPTSALKTLRMATKKHKIPTNFITEAEALISASFFRKGDFIQATRISGLAAHAGQPLGLWIRGLSAWQDKKYSAARILFSRLAEQKNLSVSNNSAAHFWAYRAAAKTGYKQQGHAHLAKASAHPKTLYGLLAAQLLNKNPITASHKKTPKWNDNHRAVLAADPAGWRALALIQVGQTERARAELRRIDPTGDRIKREAMLALTTIAPMPALTLKLASLKKKKDYQQAFYPILPWKPTGGFEIDRSLLYALARQESRFDPMAVSHRGARGLMQIMPATAKYVAKKNKMKARYYNTEALFDPSLNMTVGQKYVRQLSKMSHIGNNLMLILAAYNAGPGNAMRWIEGNETNDPLLFMESIPTRETRQYIGRVLPHYWAYRAHFGKPLDSLDQLSKGQWPTASLSEKTTVHVADASGS